jgi:excisionase family DNA binding protein
VNSDYISSPQAAKKLRITHVGVAQLARQGKIPAVKIANRWLIPRTFVEEFARTYEGKRGRPRKKKPSAVQYPVTPAPGQPVLADSVTPTDVRAPGHESSGILAVNAWVADLEETAVLPTNRGELPPVDATLAGESGDSGPAVQAASAVNAQTDQEKETPMAAPQPSELPLGEAVPVSETGAFPEPGSIALPDTRAPVVGQPDEMAAAAPPASNVEMSEAVAAPEAADTNGPGDETFSISAEVFHLDKNYDFEVYEKGEITARARLIVARLKPKIPSLPQFSFRWDYRYEHLNVDIHGVEPAVIDWWTMGENGYTGHLPRRLGGPGYAFESIIWLPVTFVFRGRLTLSLRGSPEAGEDSPSVATTTGGLRKLWAKWPTFPK